MRFSLSKLLYAMGQTVLLTTLGCTKLSQPITAALDNLAVNPLPTTVPIADCAEENTPFVDQSTLSSPIFPRRTTPNLPLTPTGFTWDGRVLIGLYASNNLPALFLTVMRPEKLNKTDGILQIPADAFAPAFLLEGAGPIDPVTKVDSHGLAFRNSTALTPVPGLTQNPFPSDAAGNPLATGPYDTYRVYLFASNYHPDLAAIGRREATIVVAEPRTAGAHIVAATLAGPQQTLVTTTGTLLRGIEPTVSHDGRLIIYQGRPENDGRIFSLVYSYNADPTSVTGWSPVRSMAAMFYAESDTVIAGIPFRDRYPIARRPILKPTGVAYVASETYAGAYPWLSQEADLLVHTTTQAGLEGRDRTIRGGHSYVSADEFIIRHIDGPLNRNREARTPGLTVRTLTPSPGVFGTLWSPFADVPNLVIPVTPHPRVMPVIDIVAMDYLEVPIDLPDKEYLVKYPMNELVPHNDTPESATSDFTRTPDVSGNFITGLLTGGAAFPLEYDGSDNTPGAKGVAIYFPATAVVRAPLVPKLAEIRRAVTVQMWVKPLVNDGSERLLVNLPGSFAMVLNPVGFRVALNVGIASYASEVAGIIPVGVWTHVAFTYDAGTGNLQLLVNGEPVLTKSFTPGLINAPVADLLIGPNGSGGADGGGAVYLLDEFAISKVVRSYEELLVAAFRDRKPLRKVNSAPLPLGLRSDEMVNLPVANAAEIDLGKQLFHDVRLSGSGQVSCATCHVPAQNFAENKPLSSATGARTLPRNTPSLLNRAFAKSFFRDGRSATLEQALLEPLHHRLEMDSKVCRVVSWLKQTPEYATKFREAFQREPNAASFAQALAAYQFSLLTGNSRFDQYAAGDVGRLTASEVRGKNLFFGKARCFGCHRGSNFSDESFHNIGVSRDVGDFGRAFSSGRSLDGGAFRTPSLRGVANTAPYFHDGSAATLSAVVDFYSEGGRQSVLQSFEIKPLNLSPSEKSDLVDFLGSLSSDGFDKTVPSPLVGLVPIYATNEATAADTFPGDANSRRVVATYRLLLLRVPDVAGFWAWKGLLDSGQLNRETFLASIFNSDEFISRHDVTKRGSASFSALLYEILLKRSAEQTEINAWKQVLEDGSTRQEVFRGFILSPEFKTKNPQI